MMKPLAAFDKPCYTEIERWNGREGAMMMETKKLYRSLRSRMLAGVCGGIGEYLGVDPTVIRVAFVLFGFAVGAGLLAYIVLWLIVPEQAD